MAMSILLPHHQAATLGERHPLLETTVTILLVRLLCDVTMMTIECEVLLRLLRPRLALTIGQAIIHLKKGHLAIPLLATESHRLWPVRHTTATTGALRLPATDTLATLRAPLLLDLEVPSVVPSLVDATNLKDLGEFYVHLITWRAKL